MSKFCMPHPYLILGSTNWTVASRAKAEVSCLTKVKSDSEELMHRFVEDMRMDESLLALRGMQDLALASGKNVTVCSEEYPLFQQHLHLKEAPATRDLSF